VQQQLSWYIYKKKRNASPQLFFPTVLGEKPLPRNREMYKIAAAAN